MARFTALVSVCALVCALSTVTLLAEDPVRILAPGEKPSPQELRGVRSAGRTLQASDWLETQRRVATRFLAEGNVERAVALLERARGVEPDDGEVQGLLGLAYLRQGRREEAVAPLKLAERLAPESWAGLLGLAVLDADAGKTGSARERLDAAIGLGGDAAREEAGSHPGLGAIR